MQDIIRVQTQDFDMQALYHQLCQANTVDGAIVTFCGLVRDLNQGQCVSSLFLEHYPSMTLKALQQIVSQARQKWVLGRVIVVHRVGELDVNAQIVFVGVSAIHRGNAFAACEFIMDYLKTQAPFWKKETTSEGQRWVSANQQDKVAAHRWSK